MSNKNNLPYNEDPSKVVRLILDIDSKSREITEQAYKDRLDAEKKLVSQKKEIREKYLNRAKHRIEVMKQDTESSNEKKIKVLSENIKIISDKLEQTAKENKQKWVEEIFNRVIAD